MENNCNKNVWCCSFHETKAKRKEIKKDPKSATKRKQKRESAILGFSLVPAETPIIVVFGDFEWAQKRTISKNR